jgi:hypothetical protein
MKVRATLLENPMEVIMSAIRGKNLNEWVAVAQKLVLNSSKNVKCPDCGEASLQVRDVEYGWGHNKGLERYLVCSSCGAFNAVNLRHARSSADAELDTPVAAEA